MQLAKGLKGKAVETVSLENTATRYGSGQVEVYGTPAMVALMERAAIAAVDHLLPEGQVTVGTRLDIRHLAATPVGMEVRAIAELVEIENRRLVFKVEAYDVNEKIGEGSHERAVVDLARFMARAQGKRET